METVERTRGRAHRFVVFGVALIALAAGAMLIQRTFTDRPAPANVDLAHQPPSSGSPSASADPSAQPVKLVIRHNWIAGKPGNNNSGALLYYIDAGPNGQKVDITIERNIINGGTYSLWLSADPRLVGPVTIRSNMFGTKYFDLCGAYHSHFTDKIHTYPNIQLTWEGNVWYAPGMAKNGSEVTYHIKY